MKFLKNLWTWFTVDLLKIMLSTQENIAKLENEVNSLLWRADNKTLVLSIDNLILKTSGDIKMAFNLKDTQQVVVTARVLDSLGNPASLVGVPAWTSSDTDVASLVVAQDGLSATIVAGTKFATTTVTFSVDGVTSTLDVSLVGGPASSAILTVGTPTDKPVPVVETPVAPTPETPAETPAAA